LKKISLLIVFAFTIGILYYWKTRDALLQVKYDLIHSDEYVDEKAEISKVLERYPLIHYKDMDENYLKETKQDIEPFRSMLAGASYYKIPQEAVYKRIVGNFRIKHFLPKDSFYKQSLVTKFDSLHFLVDIEMLYQVLAFQNKLEDAGYDRDAFTITNGYRHPQYNEAIGGASQSRHIVGEAVDITAKDVNQDGKANQEDKAIILAIAEDVVGNKGGVGMYPNTLSIHMDSRGHRARWDSF
jgi:uncharacterized protein YcbK (DUF882 family)